MSVNCEVAVVGAGAAGLMAAIFAARAGARVIAFDGAPRIGAKILISGGGRCNVTHDVVSAADFNGNRNQIAKVLRSFDVRATVSFFEDLGVSLKREGTGKLFPKSDQARTVLSAILSAARDAGVEIVTSTKIVSIEPAYLLNGSIRAERVVLATGGRSVPKTGSDGVGYGIARSLGHTVNDVFPALVPLVVDPAHWIPTLSGTSVEVELTVRSPAGRVLHRERGPMLFTHFGISGPAVLDISRHYVGRALSPSESEGRAESPPYVRLVANFLPGETFESLNAKLAAGESLRGRLPARLLAILEAPKKRREIVRSIVEHEIPVIRDRGFDYAEVTAGGVPLDEIDTATMESRVEPGLFLCGEILDVDGKIGGYNFQWAWASGRLAGIHAGGRA